MPRARPSLLLIAPVAALALAGCSSTSSTSSGGSGSGSGSGGSAGTGDGTGDTALTRSGGLLDRPLDAPVLSGATIGGGSTSTADDRGSVVVVNFYASWCGPCRAETPLLIQTASANPGVRFLGVLTQDTAPNGAAFRQTFGVTFPSLVDPDGAYLAKFRKISPAGLPVTLVLDKQGRVAAKYVGGISSAASLQSALTALQARPA